MRKLAISLLLAVPALAQTPLDFEIDQGASQWSWSGTTDLGPIIGNPSQDFALNGNFMLALTSGPMGIDSGEFVTGGAAHVVPDLSGQIPNPIPGFPPLPIVDIPGLSLEFTTAQLAIDLNGDFSGDVVCTALSGLLTVTPIVGAPTTTDLTGTAGDPTPFSGNIVRNGFKVIVDSPQTSSFSFVDPGSGMSGTFNLVGRLFGRWIAPTPVNYCIGEVNSSGLPGAITWGNSTHIEDNNFTIIGQDLPKNKFAYFIMSENQTFIPGAGGSQGNLCVGSPQIRFSAFVLNSGSSGTVSLTPDLYNLPQGATFQPGEEWNFQLWYRDNNPSATSNFTDGLTVIFAP